MRKDSKTAWSHFEIMIRTGMPHAMDIASELVLHDLQVPLPTHVVDLQVDLQFYGVIHRAYRSKVLPQFLYIMERLKKNELWCKIQGSQDAQLKVVQLCIDNGRLTLAEIETLAVSHFTQSQNALMITLKNAA